MTLYFDAFSALDLGRYSLFLALPDSRLIWTDRDVGIIRETNQKHAKNWNTN